MILTSGRDGRVSVVSVGGDFSQRRGTQLKLPHHRVEVVIRLVWRLTTDKQTVMSCLH